MRGSRLNRITSNSRAAFPLSFPFLILLSFVYFQLLITQLLMIGPTDLVPFWIAPVWGGISLLALLQAVAALLGIYVFIDFLIFFADSTSPKRVKVITCVALVVVMFGLQAALWSIGDAAENWRPETRVSRLIDRLDDRNHESAEEAIRLLTTYEAGALDAVPAIQSSIRGSRRSRQYRRDAVYSLAKIAPESESVRSFLNECLSDYDPVVQHAAEAALKRIKSRAH